MLRRDQAYTQILRNLGAPLAGLAFSHGPLGAVIIIVFHATSTVAMTNGKAVWLEPGLQIAQ